MLQFWPLTVYKWAYNDVCIYTDITLFVGVTSFHLLTAIAATVKLHSRCSNH